MENITTKLKTQFSSFRANASAHRQDENIETDNNLLFSSYTTIARNILRLVFKTQKRLIFALLFIGILAVGGYYFFDKPTPDLSAEASAKAGEKARKELAAAVASIGKLIILPEGDEPVLATVTDAETLIKQQAFFTGAVNGDQLLLFPRNVKAIIYSPSRKMIVNVGPIQQSQTTNQESGIMNRETALPSAVSAENSHIPNSDYKIPVLTVEVRNGTGKQGYAARVGGDIAARDGYSVVIVSDAAGRDYKKNIIFGKSANDRIGALAAILGAEIVSEVPKGEKDTEADILIILGGE